ncbi:MAG: bifunctional oligoribonuclease/PAP phosphatase NrnA [Cryomorphaceae bacterium]
MLNKVDPGELKKILEQKPKVLITMHKGPDGDAIGSSLGFYHFLKEKGIDAVVVAPDNFPKFLKWLPGCDHIFDCDHYPHKAEKAIKECDLIFCLDFNHPSRLGAFQDMVLKSDKPKYVIDHHQDPDGFADHYFVDSDASSTAEMIYRLAAEMEETALIDKDSAICLYTGLVTDTGSFRFSSVTPEVMQIAANLMSTGIDHVRVYNEVYDNSTLDQLKLKGYALSEKTVVVGNTGAAYISLTEEELERFNYHSGDTEGLVNYALSIEGIHVAGFFYERDGYIKLSLRSKGKVEVNKIAGALFQGGGHKMAAGGRSDLSLAKTVAKFVAVAEAGFQIEAVQS